MGRQAKIRDRRRRRNKALKAAEIDDFTGTGYRWPKEIKHGEGSSSTRSTPGTGSR